MSRSLSRSLVTVIVCSLFGPVVRFLGQDCSAPAEHYRQGVVSLTVKKTKIETGQVIESYGTGFVVSPAGFVLTADHVVSRDPATDEVKIYGSIGSMYSNSSPLRFVDEDKSADVALLRFLDGSHRYAPVRLGNPWTVPVGAQLCSLGFSAPLHADYRTTVGPLSSLTGQDDANGIFNLWTTQLPSNLGESGAPVLHLPDRGLVAIKYGGERPGTAQNVNYIIPINLAQGLLLKYAGIILPHPPPDSDSSMYLTPLKLEKIAGDQQIIPVGGWNDFEVRVVDAKGKPVAGAKVAWRLPVGGSMTYVSQTDDSGVTSATNLYTFPTEGNYLQTATVVDGSTPIGFVEPGTVSMQGKEAIFVFRQK